MLHDAALQHDVPLVAPGYDLVINCFVISVAISIISVIVISILISMVMCYQY